MVMRGALLKSISVAKTRTVVPTGHVRLKGWLISTLPKPVMVRSSAYVMPGSPSTTV